VAGRADDDVLHPLMFIVLPVWRHEAVRRMAAELKEFDCGEPKLLG